MENGILSSAKKKWIIKPWKHVEETLIYITKWKKPTLKDYILYDSIWHSGESKTVKTVKISAVARGRGEGGRESRREREREIVREKEIIKWENASKEVSGSW